MNKNIIVVGAMAVGLYLLAQANKTKKAIVKKKAPRRPPHKYYKSKIKRIIAKKKAVYNKPKIKKAVWKKKPTYYKPKPRVAVWKKKPTYYKPKPRVAVWKRQIIKRMARRKR